MSEASYMVMVLRNDTAFLICYSSCQVGLITENKAGLVPIIMSCTHNYHALCDLTHAVVSLKCVPIHPVVLRIDDVDVMLRRL